MGVRVCVANFSLGQSKGNDENNTFHFYLLYFNIKTVGATVLGGL